jgi:hypothetical protein
MRPEGGRNWATMAVALGIVLLLVVGGGGLRAGRALAHPDAAPVSAGLTTSAGPLTIQSFQFSPNSISSGSSTQGTVQLSGGTTPYSAWMNNSPNGCQPSSVPVVTSNLTTTFSCHPSSTGTFSVHLDVLDSSRPVNRASQTAMLTVSGNGGGNGSGNGKGGNGSSIFPSGLLTVVTLLAVVFLATIIAIAAGTIATAVAVSRGLRRINETLAKQLPKTPESPKPPG